MRFDYVEIGTSCFKTLAEIYKNDDSITGLSIEAVPQYLDVLKKYCKGTQKKHFLNCAITKESSRSIDFYFIDPEKVETWVAAGIAGLGCTSIDLLKNTITNQTPEFRLDCSQIKKISVPSMRFSELVEKFSIEEIGFLKIDAEGCDYDILMGMFETKIKVDSVLFEAKPFMNDVSLGNVIKLFGRYDYICKDLGKQRNYYCFQKGGTAPHNLDLIYENKNNWIKRIKESL